MSDSLWLHQAPLSMGILQAKYWSGLPCPLPGMEPRSPTLQGDSLPAEPQGNPKNTGVGSLSFLQGIFPARELNRSHMHCRWILYQLSYQGSHFRILLALHLQVSEVNPCDWLSSFLENWSHFVFPLYIKKLGSALEIVKKKSGFCYIPMRSVDFFFLFYLVINLDINC